MAPVPAGLVSSPVRMGLAVLLGLAVPPGLVVLLGLAVLLGLVVPVGLVLLTGTPGQGRPRNSMDPLIGRIMTTLGGPGPLGEAAMVPDGPMTARPRQGTRRPTR
jgi:hypothetical protein